MKYDAIIVGAGFAGMYMLYRLRGLGFSVRLLEVADGVGGTWYWNRYPGARCDVQSMDYSYSFSEELQQEWEWSEKYATQPEILRYANHVADRFDLRRDILFETSVRSARYEGAANAWSIETKSGDRIEAQFYIIATGCLSVPKAIDISGQENFTGTTYHTADWPRDGADFSGQRVAVIGTGSSAIQTIPIVADQAAALTVFQRTPAFSLAALNRPLEAEEVKLRKANYAAVRDQCRHSLFGLALETPDTLTFDATPEERKRVYELGWQTGTLTAIVQAYGDLLIDAKANDTAAEFVRNKIRDIVEDPSVAETLCPTQFPFGTKRSCLDTNYYATFNRAHVTLVDLLKTLLLGITANGIKTSAADFVFDSIIFATGFDAMTGAIVNVDIRGIDGVELKHKWADGPKTYLGLTVAGFPNLFMITGPGSPSVLSNMMVSIEQHVEWISDCLSAMRDSGATRIEATREAEDAWVEHVSEIGNATLFPQANSWYMGANVPGKPRVFLPYIGGVGAYRQKCDEVAANAYAGFIMAGADGDAIGRTASAG